MAAQRDDAGPEQALGGELVERDRSGVGEEGAEAIGPVGAEEAALDVEGAVAGPTDLAAAHLVEVADAEIGE